MAVRVDNTGFRKARGRFFNSITCSSPHAPATCQSTGLRKQSGSCKSNSQHRHEETFPCSCPHCLFCLSKQTATYQACQSGVLPQHYVHIQHTEWIVNTQTVENVAWVMFFAQWLPYWCAQYTEQMMLLLLCAHRLLENSRWGLNQMDDLSHWFIVTNARVPQLCVYLQWCLNWVCAGKATWNQVDMLIRCKKG